MTDSPFDSTDGDENCALVLEDQFAQDLHRETLGVRAGQRRTAEDEHSEALFLTSSYVFKDCADAASRFNGGTSGSVYSRYTNPTVRNFELRLAALEGQNMAPK